MTSVSNGELYISGAEEMEFESDGWVKVKIEPDGFKPLTLNLSPTFANRLRNNKLDILQAVEEADEPEAVTGGTE